MDAKGGYKGYRLIESDRAGTSHLVSPTGVRLVVFQRVAGRKLPLMKALVDGLDCGKNHKTLEHAFKYIVDRYEKLTTTKAERFSRRISNSLSHGGWAAVAAVVVAIIAFLTYIGTLA